MSSKKAKKISLIVCLLILMLWGINFALYSSVRQSEMQERKKIEVDLAEKASKHDNFLFSQVTQFKWSEVCVFIPADDSADKVPTVLGFGLDRDYKFDHWQHLVPYLGFIGHEYPMLWMFIDGDKVVEVFRGSRSFNVNGQKYTFQKDAGKGCMKANAVYVHSKSEHQTINLNFVEK